MGAARVPSALFGEVPERSFDLVMSLDELVDVESGQQRPSRDSVVESLISRPLAKTQATSPNPETVKGEADSPLKDASLVPKRKRQDVTVDRDAERKRGKRLFGSLLGTLDKATKDNKVAQQSAGATKRAELEARIVEKKQKEEQDNAIRQRDKEAKLMSDRESQVETLKAAQKAMWKRTQIFQAHHLKTKAEPALLYLPWKPTSEQQAVIDRQVADLAHDSVGVQNVDSIEGKNLTNDTEIPHMVDGTNLHFEKEISGEPTSSLIDTVDKGFAVVPPSNSDIAVHVVTDTASSEAIAKSTTPSKTVTEADSASEGLAVQETT